MSASHAAFNPRYFKKLRQSQKIAHNAAACTESEAIETALQSPSKITISRRFGFAGF
jgi:hypothetical protein